jgi:predicted transcriptional regulator
VNLSEYENEFDNPLPGAEKDEGNEGMKLSEIAKLLGLSEDATEEQVKNKVKELAEGQKPAKDDKKDDELVKLAETNPVIKQLMEQQANDRKALAEMQGKVRLAEITGNVKALHDHFREKGFALPAAIDEDLTKVLFEASSTIGSKFIDVLKQLGEKGLVKLGEQGHAGQQDGGGADPRKYFTDKVAAFQKDNGNASYADAVMAVSLAEPEAYKAYAHASYSHIDS